MRTINYDGYFVKCKKEQQFCSMCQSTKTTHRSGVCALCRDDDDISDVDVSTFLPRPARNLDDIPAVKERRRLEKDRERKRNKILPQYLLYWRSMVALTKEKGFFSVEDLAAIVGPEAFDKFEAFKGKFSKEIQYEKKYAKGRSWKIKIKERFMNSEPRVTGNKLVLLDITTRKETI